MNRIPPLLLVFAFLVSSAPALDDMRSVTAVWDDFVASVRRGDYPNAHRLFSPESRVALPYPEFVAEYGPLSPAREMVLAPPESRNLSLDGDWAEMEIGGVNAGTGRKFRVAVSFVRNQGRWGLVAARNETPEKVEAAMRGILRAVWEIRDRAPGRELAAAVMETHAASPLFKYYRLEAAGDGFQAFPLRPDLRAFRVDALGMVRALGQTGAPEDAAPAALPPPPPRRTPPPERTAGADGFGPPEMPEPPPPFEAGPMGELPEPPAFGGGSAAEDAPVLPDAIR